MQVNSINNRPSFGASQSILTKYVLAQLDDIDRKPILEILPKIYKGDYLATSQFSDGNLVMGMYNIHGKRTKRIIKPKDMVKVDINYVLEKPKEFAEKLYNALVKASENRRQRK